MFSFCVALLAVNILYLVYSKGRADGLRRASLMLETLAAKARELERLNNV